MDSTILKTLACLSLVSVALACNIDADDDDDDAADDSTGADDDDGDDDDSADDDADAGDDSPTDATVTTTVGDDDTTGADDDDTTGADDDDDDTTGADDDTTGADDDATTGTDDGTTTETGVGECQVVDITGDLATVEPNLYGWFAQNLLGDPLENDGIFLQFFSAQTGVFDLSTAPNDNYATCDQCVIGNEDMETRFYFQSSGTIEVLEDPTTGVLSAILTDVTLIEVTIDEQTAESTPVPNGGCVEIVDGEVANIVVPDEWTCNPDLYTDNLCDCGCGVVDPVCDDATVESCDSCNEEGSCSADADECPGTIDPENNAVCVP